MYEQHYEDSDHGKCEESDGQLLEECGRLAVAAGFAAVAFDRIAVLAIIDEVAAHLFVVGIERSLVLLLEQLLREFGDFHAPVRVGYNGLFLRSSLSMVARQRLAMFDLSHLKENSWILCSAQPKR